MASPPHPDSPKDAAAVPKTRKSGPQSSPASGSGGSQPVPGTAAVKHDRQKAEPQTYDEQYDLPDKDGWNPAPPTGEGRWLLFPGHGESEGHFFWWNEGTDKSAWAPRKPDPEASTHGPQGAKTTTEAR